MDYYIYTKNNIHKLDKVSNLTDEMLNYLVPIIEKGSHYFIDNANVEMCLLVINNKGMPIIINHGKNEEQCVLTSFLVRYQAYFKYFLTNKIEGKLVRNFLFMLLDKLVVFLQWCRLDRSVSLNNWLIHSNPKEIDKFSDDEWNQIIAFLSSYYPGYLIEYRGLDHVYTNKPSLEYFVKHGKIQDYRICYYRNPNAKKNNNYKNDLRLWKKTTLQVQEEPFHDANLITSLYRSLYVKKHSLHHVHNNAKWFALTQDSGFVKYILVKQDGKVLGFFSFYTFNDKITPSYIGHDLGLNKDFGIYRLEWMYVIRLSEKHEKELAMSAGSDKFKKLRGGHPVKEYIGLYDRHLSFFKRRIFRFLWFLLDLIPTPK
jgi:hypothetical protein